MTLVVPEVEVCCSVHKCVVCSVWTCLWDLVTEPSCMLLWSGGGTGEASCLAHT